MKLSTKSRYGLRILMQIAIDSKKVKAVKGRCIAKKQEISEAYLEQIMIPLKNSNIVRTIRGCNGGYALNRDTEDITVLDVIELFEGELKLVKCEKGSTSCARTDVCPTSEVWAHLSAVLREEASKITLASLVAKVEVDSIPEYVI